MNYTTRHLTHLLCALLLATIFCLHVFSAQQESQTIDEAVHLTAGVSYVTTGDFRLNPEHPPLIKELAALPVILAGAKFPITSTNWKTWNQYALGSEFLYHNILSHQTILLLGRLPIILLSVLLGWWIFRTSREVFGDVGGLLSLTLYTFDPGFLAHGHYITTDLGFTALSFWTVLRLRKLLHQPTQRHLIIFALALWCAAMSKFTILAFLIVLGIVFVLLKIQTPRHPSLQFKRGFKIVLISLPFLALLTWTFYGFDVRRRIDDPRIKELYNQRIDYLAKTDISTTSPLVRFVLDNVGNTNTTLGAWIDRTSTMSVPGYAFFRGTIAVIGHSIGGQEAYLHGQFSDTGWWYYFPVALLIKTPFPTLFAFIGIYVMAIAWLLNQRKKNQSWLIVYRQIDQTWLLFLSIPIIYLGISMGSHLNLGWRHIMPMYPYLFVLTGFFGSKIFLSQRRSYLSLPIFLVIGILLTQVTTWPKNIGYFNSLVGGSTNGQSWLLDSNLDWGQDLPKLSRWMEQNNLTTLPLAYYGWADVASFITPQNLPNNSNIADGKIIHGYAAISIGTLYNRENSYSWWRNQKPIQRLGSSIFLYNLP